MTHPGPVERFQLRFFLKRVANYFEKSYGGICALCKNPIKKASRKTISYFTNRGVAVSNLLFLRADVLSLSVYIKGF